MVPTGDDPALTGVVGRRATVTPDVRGHALPGRRPHAVPVADDRGPPHHRWARRAVFLDVEALRLLTRPRCTTSRAARPDVGHCRGRRLPAATLTATPPERALFAACPRDAVVGAGTRARTCRGGRAVPTTPASTSRRTRSSLGQGRRFGGTSPSCSTRPRRC